MDGLFVVTLNNLPADFDEVEAEELGEEFGSIREVWLDHTARGLTAFLVYTELRSALEAVEVLNDEEIDGHELQARLLKGRDDFDDGFGGFDTMSHSPRNSSASTDVIRLFADQAVASDDDLDDDLDDEEDDAFDDHDQESDVDLVEWDDDEAPQRTHAGAA